MKKTENKKPTKMKTIIIYMNNDNSVSLLKTNLVALLIFGLINVFETEQSYGCENPQRFYE